MDNNNNHTVVCFGEVLWDILPTGAVPGGAPMNVAYHLHKQKIDPALITKIGIDDEGKKLINIFSRQGICTDFFQVDYKNQTGKVYARPANDNEMVYDILMPVAWDFIQLEDELNNLVATADYFLFGSLAARNKVSKATLFRLLEIAKNKVLDINLRAPHFNKQGVIELLSKADFLKINMTELELITGWFSNHKSIVDRMKSVRDKFKIANMVVTVGADGAVLYMNETITIHKGFKVDVVDTVGSGDAFLAGLLGKLIKNTGPEEALEFACGLGAFIATQQGACPQYELQMVTDLIDTKKEYFNLK